METCLFAHGFEGVPQGRKAQYLGELGYEVVAPRMTEKGWTFEDQVSVLLEAIDARPDLRRAVGSSMGAFALAVAAARRPDRDLRLVLLAPAVGLHQTWAARLGEDGMARWAERGTLDHHHHGVGREVALPYVLWTQCRDHAGVALVHPTVIVHGLHDDTIPVENALALARRSPGVRRLYAVDDGHRLLESLDLIGEGLGLLDATVGSGRRRRG